MGFWFFRKRDVVDELKQDLDNSFGAVKHDMGKLSHWIKHLHKKDGHHEGKIEQIYAEILEIKQDVDGIKKFVSFFDTKIAGRMFKQKAEVFNKQTAVYGVQTPVQTAVQTAFLRNLTVMERAITWILLNTDMKLSYEDIAAVLGKDKATVRVQLNNIKQKTDLLSEVVEKNGKKRYFINEKIKDMVFKTIKIGQRVGKVGQKSLKSSKLKK